MLALGIAAGEAGSLVEDVLRQHGLTHARYNVLRILRGAGAAGASCAQLAERLLVPSPDVTRLVDPLVRAALVARDRLPEDRRIVVQRLTRKGAALLERLHPPLTAIQQSLLKALGPGDAARLVELCEAVMEWARAERA